MQISENLQRPVLGMSLQVGRVCELTRVRSELLRKADGFITDVFLQAFSGHCASKLICKRLQLLFQ